jgi:hypothetical protein
MPQTKKQRERERSCMEVNVKSNLIIFLELIDDLHVLIFFFRRNAFFLCLINFKPFNLFSKL